MSSDAVAYFRSTADPVREITREYEELRRKQADKEFWELLGAEVGPKVCNEPGCGRLRVKHSAFCPLHHFKMIKARPPPTD